MFSTIFPKIHKEGYKFLAISILATFIVLFFSELLGLIFILVVQPIAFIMRIFGYDPLKQRKSEENSYREIRKHCKIDLRRIF